VVMGAFAAAAAKAPTTTVRFLVQVLRGKTGRGPLEFTSVSWLAGIQIGVDSAPCAYPEAGHACWLAKHRRESEGRLEGVLVRVGHFPRLVARCRLAFCVTAWAESS
jgi:hypothetical protein